MVLIMKNASKNDSGKKNAGYKAAEYVEDGMILGLGTGSTTHYFIEKVGMRMVEEGINVKGIPTYPRLLYRLIIRKAPAEITVMFEYHFLCRL